MEVLVGRWGDDVRAAVPDADPEVVTRVGADLLRRWREPHRHYHGPQHLHEVLVAVDRLCRAGRVGPRERSVAVLAAWFHDAVYAVEDPSGNEARSASLALDDLTALGAGGGLVDDVVTAVLDTAAHDVEADSRASRVVLHDADLWVLAAPTDRFDEYCAQVRAEYAAVPAPEYAAARAAILRPFLGRPHLYATDHGRTAWESDARENLAREISRLGR